MVQSNFTTLAKGGKNIKRGSIINTSLSQVADMGLPWVTRILKSCFQRVKTELLSKHKTSKDKVDPTAQNVTPINIFLTVNHGEMISSSKHVVFDNHQRVSSSDDDIPPEGNGLSTDIEHR